MSEQPVGAEPARSKAPASETGSLSPVTISLPCRHDRPASRCAGDAENYQLPAQLGRFEVHGEVGRGGMGAVLLGRDPALGRDLALKVLLSRHQDNDEVLRRFHEEAQIGGQLQHPGFVPVYELGADPEGRPFFAMKLVDGRTLAQLLRQRPDCSAELPRFLTIFEQVCQAVGYAHARGVLHRDLKPANVMVGAFGEVQVMDWGFAKVLAAPRLAGDAAAVQVAPPQADPPAASSERIVGTPSYMAPEQARGNSDLVDARADVFGLGALLCVILTGTPPFTSGGPSDNLLAAAQGNLADAFARLDGCGADPELIQLARTCLAPNPDDRPRNGTAVAALVAAYRAGVAQRLRRAELERAAAEARVVEERKRRQTQLALAGALLLLLALGGGGSWYVRQQHLDRLAEQARQEAELTRAVESGLAELAHERTKPRPDWNRVGEMLQRIEGRLEQGGPDALQQQIRQVRDDLTRVRRDQQTVARLEEARLQFAAAGELGFDPAGSRQQFADVFADYGLGQGTPAEVAARIKASDIRDAFVIALDRWAALVAPDEAQRLRTIAQETDDNPWRRNLRSALAQQDHEFVRRLAEQADLAELPPASIVLLAGALRQAQAEERAIAVLRQGRLLHPDDLWLNFDLAQSLHNATPPQPALAVRYYTAAQTLRPDSIGILNNLGIALKDQGQPAEAVAILRKAVQLRPDLVLAHNTLGVALQTDDKLAEAAAAYREAIRLKPDHAPAHSNLGYVLAEQGKLADAVAACREAIRLQPDFAFAHNNLGIALRKQKKLPEALAAYREALRLKPDFPEAHNNLGLALAAQGKAPEALAAYRQALQLRPEYAAAHFNLGAFLQYQGQLPEAVAAYREAIRLKPEYAAAHWNLGSALRERGELIAARDAMRRGHELGAKLPSWHYPSEQWLKEIDRLIELEPRLPDVLAGKVKPASAAEQVELAGLCVVKHRYAAAVHLFAEAFQAEPKLANDLVMGPRYNAACCAVLTAAGKDDEARIVADAERVRLRRQGLDWLRAELAAWGKRLESARPAERPRIAARLGDWLSDTDLASVRAAALAELPEAERGAWGQLWQDVAALRQRAAAPQ